MRYYSESNCATPSQNALEEEKREQFTPQPDSSHITFETRTHRGISRQPPQGIIISTLSAEGFSRATQH